MRQVRDHQERGATPLQGVPHQPRPAAAIDSGDADALAALSDHTADTDGWDDEFLPGYASGASDDGDLFEILEQPVSRQISVWISYPDRGMT